MKKLKSIQVGSVFRVSAILGSVAGFLVGTILMIVDFIDKRFLEGAATFVLAPILYGLIGALVNAFMAWAYNAVAAKWGGVEIELED